MKAQGDPPSSASRSVAHALNQGPGVHYTVVHSKKYNTRFVQLLQPTGKSSIIAELTWLPLLRSTGVFYDESSRRILPTPADLQHWGWMMAGSTYNEEVGVELW